VPDSGIAVIQTGSGIIHALLLWSTKTRIYVAGVPYSRRTWRRLGWKSGGFVPFIMGFLPIDATVDTLHLAVLPNKEVPF
jgi:hypothetical protein